MGLKRIKGFDNYAVSSNGDVYKVKSDGDKKKLKPYDNGHGYKQVKLWKDGSRVTKQVSRLVAGEPLGKDVDHKNNNKGDNASSNLQELSHRDNVKKAFEK